MDQKEFGKFIAKLRKDKKLTQEKLGEKLGVNSRTISRWENGNYMPDISLFEDLSNELDVSVLELLKCKRIEKENYVDETNKNTIEILKKGKNIKRKSLIIITFCLIILLFLGVFSLYQYLKIKELKLEDDTIVFENGIYVNELGIKINEKEYQILSFFDVDVRNVNDSDKDNYVNYYYGEWETIKWYGGRRFYEKIKGEDDYVIVKVTKQSLPFILANAYDVEEKKYCVFGYSKYGTYIVGDYVDDKCIVDDILCERLKSDGATIVGDLNKVCK